MPAPRELQSHPYTIESRLMAFTGASHTSQCLLQEQVSQFVTSDGCAVPHDFALLRLTGLQLLRIASAGCDGRQCASGHDNDHDSDHDNDHTSDNTSETSGSSEACWKRQWRARDSGPGNRVKRWIGPWRTTTSCSARPASVD